MDLNDIKRQIKKFFREENSKDGHRFIEYWYHSFDNKPKELEEMNSEEKEDLRESLYEDIRRSAGFPQIRLKWMERHRRSSKRTWPYKMAAGFVVLLLALIPVLMFTSEDPAPESTEFIASSNPAGQSSQITLADGSVVWLSANSSLQYPEKFVEEQREVTLQGEAFFDVAENSEKPFVVKSAGLQTRVLGTSFNVRAFDDDEEIEITVVSGRVSVAQMTNESDTERENFEPVALLNRDEQLLYNHNTRQTRTQSVDSKLYTSWRAGHLSFENHSFEEIARRLERWYGVEIHFADDDLKEARFRITFENRSLQHALEMLQAIKGFTFKIDAGERQIWINK